MAPRVRARALGCAASRDRGGAVLGLPTGASEAGSPWCVPARHRWAAAAALAARPDDGTRHPDELLVSPVWSRVQVRRMPIRTRLRRSRRGSTSFVRPISRSSLHSCAAELMGLVRNAEQYGEAALNGLLELVMVEGKAWLSSADPGPAEARATAVGAQWQARTYDSFLCRLEGATRPPGA